MKNLSESYLPEVKQPHVIKQPSNGLVESSTTAQSPFASGNGLPTTIKAISHVCGLRGGSQPQLMIGEDREGYVVKFQDNPQQTSILANEMLATNLARALFLPVPECAVIEVSARLILDTPSLTMEAARGNRISCVAGRQFGSKLIGGLRRDRVYPYLPEDAVNLISNVEAFWGMLCFDKWTSNTDGRQAVFHQRRKGSTYKTYFIDHGFCFCANDWTFLDAPLRGVYGRNQVYARVAGWGGFEPWLARIEEMSIDAIWGAAKDIPPEWYCGKAQRLERLVEQLYKRRPIVRGLIEDFRDSTREPFPLWTGRKPGERRKYSFLEKIV